MSRVQQPLAISSGMTREGERGSWNERVHEEEAGNKTKDLGLEAGSESASQNNTGVPKGTYGHRQVTPPIRTQLL